MVLANESRGIELDEPSEGRDFGTRFHQLLHERRCRQLALSIHSGAKLVGGGLDSETYPEWPDEDIEAEAQATLAAYEAHYVRDFEYLESERTHCLELPKRCPDCWELGIQGPRLLENERWCEKCERVFGTHQLCVKLDAVVRHLDATIGPMDTKTESRTGYNDRENWAGRTQAKAYLWALAQLYPHEKVSRLVVDVVTRGSAKMRRQPIFTRLDDISSTSAEINEAIRNIVCVAEDIERSRVLGWWRSNMNLCKRGWERCDYYFLHVLGRTPENLKRYRVAEQYLEI